MIPALADTTPRLVPMDGATLDKVRRLESALSTQPQVAIRTAHTIHGGMYARTIRIPAGAVLTGALIKRATLLVVSGDVSIFTGGDTIELCGYHVVPASAGRKQVFYAHADTDLTMLFPSSAATVEEAEAEFTNEGHLLMSRQCADLDYVTITGE